MKMDSREAEARCRMVAEEAAKVGAVVQLTPDTFIVRMREGRLVANREFSIKSLMNVVGPRAYIRDGIKTMKKAMDEQLKNRGRG